MSNETPIFVVVCSSDGGRDPNEDGPIVMETYTTGATLDRARQRASLMESKTRHRYGPTRIARLIFEDHPAFAEGLPPTQGA